MVIVLAEHAKLNICSFAHMKQTKKTAIIHLLRNSANFPVLEALFRSTRVYHRRAYNCEKFVVITR